LLGPGKEFGKEESADFNKLQQIKDPMSTTDQGASVYSPGKIACRVCISCVESPSKERYEECGNNPEAGEYRREDSIVTQLLNDLEWPSLELRGKDREMSPHRSFSRIVAW